MTETIQNIIIQKVVLGNEAIARGLIEAGVNIATSYPGSPSSEILPAIIKYNKMENLNIHTEWSTNEKVALEVAASASYTGKRSVVIMKQVGLNVAMDSLMSSAYNGVVGGFIIISADDPGPHSSQTEQDTRFIAMVAHLPVFDPSSPREAQEMIKIAFELSEKYSIPVLFRPALRVCHAIQNIPFNPIEILEHKANFQKDPKRWAIPKYKYSLHKQLNEKIALITDEMENSKLNFINYPDNKLQYPLGIITSGVTYNILLDLLREKGLEKQIPILKIGLAYPLPPQLIADFINHCDNILVLEEPDYTIELQIRDKSKILGRLNNFVPSAGELTTEVIYQIISPLLKEYYDYELTSLEDTNLINEIKALDLPIRRPKLCPGCGHRAAFFAIRKAFPKGIFPSDIGCYTLGVYLKAVDIIIAMGASVNIASGLYQAYKQDNKEIPIIATIGDSTFLHSAPSSLVNAVYNNARFVLVILDNDITAMSGMQPTPLLGTLADGSKGKKIDLEKLVKGCGIEYYKVIDAYDIPEMIEEVKKAQEYVTSDDGGIAIIIAKHPCMIAYRGKLKKELADKKVIINENCNGCKYCITYFECPALIYVDNKDKSKRKVIIDPRICVNCGCCIYACPHNAIEYNTIKN